MSATANIEIPFRRSVSLDLSSAVKQYISSKYDQHPDMFTADLADIDRLRADAINVQEPHESGIRKLAEYASQLQWISGKFPIDIGADFTWYLAVGYNLTSAVTQNNMQFERANVLFNLASLYSQLATSFVRDTSAAGLKTACNYYCASAGVFKYLRESVIPGLRSTPPEDMDAMTLACLEQLMLAQAQECFWLKAVNDENKDSVVARLAASVSDYFDTAAEFGTKSSSIRQEWISHMSAKHSHFAAAAQFRAARDCLDRSKYGEEVARLKDSLDAVNSALKGNRYLNKLVVEDLMGLRDVASKVLKGAEKDNDLIYFCPVPAVASLPRISRASMVQSRIPKEVSEGMSMLSDTGPYGAPLFTKLVPFAVHVGVSVYVERRDRLVNNTVDELEALTTKLHDLLQSLNLPGSLQALEKPLGLPPGIVSRAEEFRQQGGVEKLVASIQDIDKLRANDLAMYQEGVELLSTEATEDVKLRNKHGTDRWNRSPSNIAAGKLTGQISEYEGILTSAGNSDKLVRSKLAESEDIFKLLGGRIHDLEEFVPNSSRTKLTSKVDREVGKLRQCLNEVSRLESRRRRKVEALQQKAKSDDITPSILAESSRFEREDPMHKLESADFDPLFISRLESRYGADQKILVEESEDQSELVGRLKEANASFLACRRMDSSLKEREAAIQTLESAYFRYKELMGNLDVGRKFYNDLAKLLSRFRDEAKNFVYQRRMEAGGVEVDITSSLHNLRISTPTGTGISIPPHQQLPLHMQQQQQLQESSPRPTRAVVPPSPGLWSGDSTTTIRFAPPSNH